MRPQLLDLIRMTAGLKKLAAPRWVREVQKGNVSPAGVGRIAQSMDPGKMRYIRSLGRGQMNLADLMVGKSQGGEAGQLVRKLPIQQVRSSLGAHYQPVVADSARVEAAAPGLHARALGAGPGGLVQQYGDKQVIPGWVHPDQPGGFAHPMVNALNRTLRPLRDLGWSDIGPENAGNIGPGGQVIDWLNPYMKSHALNHPALSGLPYIPPHVEAAPARSTPAPDSYWESLRSRYRDSVRRWWLNPAGAGQAIPATVPSVTGEPAKSAGDAMPPLTSPIISIDDQPVTAQTEDDDAGESPSYQDSSSVSAQGAMKSLDQPSAGYGPLAMSAPLVKPAALLRRILRR